MARALNEHEELASHLANQEKYAVLGKLASGMAHEVNNPLGGLFNALDTLRRHGDDAKVREATLNLLERGLTHIRNVVGSTLVMYRRGVADNSLRPVDIDDLRLLIEPEASRKRLQIAWVNDLHGVSPVAVESVRQVILNLLINACAATSGMAEPSICERAPPKAGSRSRSVIKARDCLTILPNTSSDIPMRRPALGAALDFGSCAVSSRTKTERYKSFRKTACRRSSGLHGPSAKISHDSKAQRTLFGVEAIHVE